MDWRDTGILLATRRHGESSLILDVFTPGHGRHAGVLRGGTSRKLSPHLQPGAQLDLTWRARVQDSLGTFTVEPIRARAALVLSDRLSLAGLTATCAMLRWSLPERAPHPNLYTASTALLDMLDRSDLWPLAYLHWERLLLEDMGFGLDLGACAVTGARTGLTHISPRTGRAVTTQGAGDWADRLLPLPPVLLGQGNGSDDQIVLALQTLGYFFENRLATQQGAPPPAARRALLDRLTRRAGV